MSIKQPTKRARARSPKTKDPAKFPERYVVPESAIREFVQGLGIFDIEEAATRLQAVADATSQILEHRIEQLRPADMRLIMRIAAESRTGRYRRIMKAIIASVAQGPEGIKAAHLTANRAVELTFRWTPDYISAFKQFKNKLRENRLMEESRRSTTTQKPLLRLVAAER